MDLENITAVFVIVLLIYTSVRILYPVHSLKRLQHCMLVPSQQNVVKGPHPIRRRRHSYHSEIVDSHALLSEESGSDLNQCPSNEAGRL